MGADCPWEICDVTLSELLRFCSGNSKSNQCAGSFSRRRSLRIRIASLVTVRHSAMATVSICWNVSAQKNRSDSVSDGASALNNSNKGAYVSSMLLFMANRSSNVSLLSRERHDLSILYSSVLLKFEQHSLISAFILSIGLCIGLLQK